MKRVLAIGALLLALTGCGTIGNFARESPLDATPYGGVEIAVDWAKTRPRIPDVLLYSDSLAATNVAFSAVGDTLTLPITLPLAAWRAGKVLLFLASDDNTPPRSNEWSEFWFNEQNSEGTPTAPSRAPQHIP